MQWICLTDADDGAPVVLQRLFITGFSTSNHKGSQTSIWMTNDKSYLPVKETPKEVAEAQCFQEPAAALRQWEEDHKAD